VLPSIRAGGFIASADMNNSHIKYSCKALDSNILSKHVLMLCQRLKGLDVMQFQPFET
jgi:hypothetical protein